MHRNVLTVLVGVLVLAFVSSAFFVLGSRSSVTRTQSESDLVAYASEGLGFTMGIPQSVLGVNRCEEEQPTFSVPVKVFEDVANKIAYVTPEYYYDQPNEYNEEQQKIVYSGSCEKVTASLASLKKESENAQGRITKPFMGWAVKVDSFSDTEEETFDSRLVKPLFGECFLWTNPVGGWWAPDGYDEVAIVLKPEIKAQEDVRFSNGECGGAVPKGITEYVEQKIRAAALDLGQEATFWKNAEATDAYDFGMLRSFRFTD